MAAQGKIKREYFPIDRRNLENAAPQPYLEMEAGLEDGEFTILFICLFFTFYFYF